MYNFIIFYRRQKWINNCNLEDFLSDQTLFLLPKYRVCSLHFEERFFKNALTKKYLRPDAVPTVFYDCIVLEESCVDISENNDLLNNNIDSSDVSYEIVYL